MRGADSLMRRSARRGARQAVAGIGTRSAVLSRAPSVATGLARSLPMHPWVHAALLSSSAKGSKAGGVEEYERKTPVEHVLLRPGSCDIIQAWRVERLWKRVPYALSCANLIRHVHWVGSGC